MKLKQEWYLKRERKSAQHAEGRYWQVVYDIVPSTDMETAQSFSEMYAQTPHQRKSRNSTKPDYYFLVLPELGLFVEYGEAESVELEVDACQLDVLRQECVAQDRLTAGSLGTTTMTVAMKLIMKYVKS